MKSYTTEEAAEAVGISRATLQAWIASGQFKAPEVLLVEGKAVRLWNADDLGKLSSVKAKIYRKGRGRKPKRGTKRKRAGGRNGK
jgi:excisionase family DNA binding protein